MMTWNEPLGLLLRNCLKMETLFSLNRVIKLLGNSVERWHAGLIVHDEREEFWKLLLLLQSHNFEIWHEEDKARDPKAGAEKVAQVKRNIDALNQKRNDTMEKLDEYILEQLNRTGIRPAPDASLHSETVGSILDRLSIQALRIFHMREEALREDADEPHRRECRERLSILEEQQKDLHDCLGTFQEELLSGRRLFKVYRQMKMYNDPNLNPVLYGGSK